MPTNPTGRDELVERVTEPRQDTVEKVAEAIAVALTNGDEDYWASHECHLECARAAINAMSDVREALEHDPSAWRSPDTAPKDGTLLELVVDYSDGGGPLQDATIACTVGFNGFNDTGEDEWKFAGWCWTHDHFTEGRGKVIAWRPSRLNAIGDDGSIGPLP